MTRTILSLCDITKTWPEPYRTAGYNVVTIDLQSDGTDVRLMYRPTFEVHGILAAPPLHCVRQQWSSLAAIGGRHA